MRIIVVFAVLFRPLPFPLSTGAQTFGGVGSRAEGMGGAFVAVADDASAVYWNPAGLLADRVDLRSSGRRVGDKARRSSVGAALPVFGLSYYRDPPGRPFTYSFTPRLTDKTRDRERCRSARSRPRTSASQSCKPL